MSDRVYHTFYAEFRGASADQIVDQLYEDSRKGTGADFATWWAYQKTIWKDRCGLSVPDDPNAPGASETFIDILLKAGVLEPGPRRQESKPGADRGRAI